MSLDLNPETYILQTNHILFDISTYIYWGWAGYPAIVDLSGPILNDILHPAQP